MSVAFAAELTDDLAEWSLSKVQIAFDDEASRSANSFELGEHEVAPFFLESDDISEEPDVVVLPANPRWQTMSSSTMDRKTCRLPSGLCYSLGCGAAVTARAILP